MPAGLRTRNEGTRASSRLKGAAPPEPPPPPPKPAHTKATDLTQGKRGAQEEEAPEEQAEEVDEDGDFDAFVGKGNQARKPRKKRDTRGAVPAGGKGGKDGKNDKKDAHVPVDPLPSPRGEIVPLVKEHAVSDGDAASSRTSDNEKNKKKKKTTDADPVAPAPPASPSPSPTPPPQVPRADPEGQGPGSPATLMPPEHQPGDAPPKRRRAAPKKRIRGFPDPDVLDLSQFDPESFSFNEEEERAYLEKVEAEEAAKSGEGAGHRPGPLPNEAKKELSEMQGQMGARVHAFSRRWNKAPGVVWDEITSVFALKRADTLWNLFSKKHSSERGKREGESRMDYLHRTLAAYKAEVLSLSDDDKADVYDDLVRWQQDYGRAVSEVRKRKDEHWRSVVDAEKALSREGAYWYDRDRTVSFGFVINTHPDAAASAASTTFACSAAVRSWAARKSVDLNKLAASFTMTFGAREQARALIGDYSDAALEKVLAMHDEQGQQRDYIRLAMLKLQNEGLDVSEATVRWRKFNGMMIKRDVVGRHWPKDARTPTDVRDNKYKQEELRPLLTAVYKTNRREPDPDFKPIKFVKLNQTQLEWKKSNSKLYYDIVLWKDDEGNDILTIGQALGKQAREANDVREPPERQAGTDQKKSGKKGKKSEKEEKKKEEKKKAAQGLKGKRERVKKSDVTFLSREFIDDSDAEIEEEEEEEEEGEMSLGGSSDEEDDVQQGPPAPPKQVGGGSYPDVYWDAPSESEDSVPENLPDPNRRRKNPGYMDIDIDNDGEEMMSKRPTQPQDEGTHMQKKRKLDVANGDSRLSTQPPSRRPPKAAPRRLAQLPSRPPSSAGARPVQAGFARDMSAASSRAAPSSYTTGRFSRKMSVASSRAGPSSRTGFSREMSAASSRPGPSSRAGPSRDRSVMPDDNPNLTWQQQQQQYEVQQMRQATNDYAMLDNTGPPYNNQMQFQGDAGMGGVGYGGMRAMNGMGGMNGGWANGMGMGMGMGMGGMNGMNGGWMNGMGMGGMGVGGMGMGMGGMADGGLQNPSSSTMPMLPGRALSPDESRMLPPEDVRASGSRNTYDFPFNNPQNHERIDSLISARSNLLKAIMVKPMQHNDSNDSLPSLEEPDWDSSEDESARPVPSAHPAPTASLADWAPDFGVPVTECMWGTNNVARNVLLSKAASLARIHGELSALGTVSLDAPRGPGPARDSTRWRTFDTSRILLKDTPPPSPSVTAPKTRSWVYFVRMIFKRIACTLSGKRSGTATRRG
ncbi:hypothetical protein EXIGLDRAFT_776949 [Exidia glandulosa HHB12029]|uniref:Uncharacterized protein n=1 Tax=Exidia glandulosa HHB12029 TaxID=1314781 RepID=A0A165D926_EXIGL|nr:hypothetical protein EXIGLDRAFT_776949 [Exidia glandulosa HHB12029]